MILDILRNATHRKMYKAAEIAFSHDYDWGRSWRHGRAYCPVRRENFFIAFAKSYNARIIFTRQHEWLDITALEFDNEKDYLMFALKWS